MEGEQGQGDAGTKEDAGRRTRLRRREGDAEVRVGGGLGPLSQSAAPRDPNLALGAESGRRRVCFYLLEFSFKLPYTQLLVSVFLFESAII